jgi:hypothetical protein
MTHHQNNACHRSAQLQQPDQEPQQLHGW